MGFFDEVGDFFSDAGKSLGDAFGGISGIGGIISGDPLTSLFTIGTSLLGGIGSKRAADKQNKENKKTTQQQIADIAAYRKYLQEAIKKDRDFFIGQANRGGHQFNKLRSSPGYYS